ncbi:hypothetical protein ABZ330_12800 [Streptomyces sp. NPDC006172]|uniref:hypothetical protein n=1 Tax=Streptomyces sp. NPDC006172 TaxID=3154470 RepID=UPI0034036F7B
MQYLSAHLDRIDAGPADRLPLVHERWRQAWQYVEGTDSGFLADVRACRRTLTTCQTRSRAETLAWVGVLLPVLTGLGGPDTPERLFDVVEEVAAAWP